MDVLAEDERLIAVSKPCGLLTIPGRGVSGPTLLGLVEARLGAKAYVVHRLDREASGLVLFAKSAEAHRELSLLFERRRVLKTYWALVAGRPPARGVIRAPLREFGSGRVGAHPEGRSAWTRYRLLKRFADASLLEVEPVTGRRHQIRAHLYSIGHPILGDTRYGGARPVAGAGRLMLHAQALRLGPRGARQILAPVPNDFNRVLDAQPPASARLAKTP